MKIRPVRADLFHADRRTDGWTDMTKLKLAFLRFANALNTYVDKAPKVRPTSSELTLYTSNYARCRQPTARVAVSSGPPPHSCHNKKTFQQFILFAILYRVPFSMPMLVFIFKCRPPPPNY